MRNIKAAIVVFWTLCLASVSVFAAPTVTLLTSMDPSAGAPSWDQGKWNGNRVLETEFRKHFENSGYQIVVEHQADAETVWNALHSPDNVAVFFVGHAGDSMPTDSGVVREEKIADISGYDLRDVFRGVSPNLKVLAVIGCHSQMIFNTLREEGAYLNDPDLHIIAFDRLIDPFKAWIEMPFNSGLSKALERADAILATPGIKEQASCDRTIPGYPIIIERKIPSDVSEASVQTVLVKTPHTSLAFFPKGRPGETQTRLAWLDPRYVQDRSDLKLSMDSGAPPSAAITGVTLGSFRVLANGKELWKPLTGHDGRVLGATWNLYRYQGSTINLGSMINHPPAGCPLN